MSRKFWLLAAYLVLTGLISKETQAQVAAIKTADQYVALAVSYPLDDSRFSNKASCRYVGGQALNPLNLLTLVGYGPDISQASQILALKCVKLKCENLGSLVQEGMNYIRQFSDADMAEYLKTQGYSESEIQNVIKNRKSFNTQQSQALKCETTTPLSRLLIVNSCFTAMECGN